MDIADMKAYFAAGQTHSVAFRRQMLIRLMTGIQQMEEELLEALSNDLGKAAFEGYATEIGQVYGEIHCALRHLNRWTRPKRVGMPLTQFPSTGWVYPQPKGVVLIIAPWNYPMQLTLSPLVAALSAGNCAVIKPSEYAPATAEALERLVKSCFPENYVRVVQGGVETNQALLAQPFDHIFFTGSTKVGRIVMRAAAQTLCPVTLELGGKSPCIVERSADVSLAAKRMAWGKWLNAGQTCVAPDYVLIDRRLEQAFLDALKHWVNSFYGEHPLEHPDYPRIVGKAHLDRLLALLTAQDIVFGGECAGLKLAPTVLRNASLQSPVMQEEIFGPILPVIGYDTLDEALSVIKSRPTPLACYLFTRNKNVKKQVLGSLPFGGGCVNDTIVHLSSSRLPFGGLGQSGMGAYHGKAGFDTFSHEKAIVEKGRLDTPFRYPPYREKLGLIKRLMK